LLTSESRVFLQPFVIRKERMGFIFENKQTNEFFEMPFVCIEAIKLLESGKSVGETEEVLKTKYPDEDINIMHFIKDLKELCLLRQIDEEEITVKPPASKASMFLWVSPSLGKCFFNKYSMRLYIFFLIACMLFMAVKPSLIPEYGDLFIFQTMFYNIVVFLVISLILVLIHEAGHVLAIRAFNLPTRLEVGHRLFFIVMETDMTAGWKLPARDRNILFLAGVCFDIAILFVSFMLEVLVQPINNSFLLDLLRLINLNIFLRLLFQCALYMKTDFYYLLGNMTGCYNLMEDSIAYLSRRLPFVRKGSTTGEIDEAKRIIKWYSFLFISGTIISLILYIFYIIPQLIYTINRAYHSLQYPFGTHQFLDGFTVILQIVILSFLLVYSWMKSLKLKRF
jgi:putative peptide zinc metalloprotease protein